MGVHVRLCAADKSTNRQRKLCGPKPRKKAVVQKGQLRDARKLLKWNECMFRELKVNKGQVLDQVTVSFDEEAQGGLCLDWCQDRGD
jgi:hypothetical protein